MIYLKIMGNCGNQFFQYAFARQLQEIYGGELVIDYSLVNSTPDILNGSDNLLSQFNTVSFECVNDSSRNPHRLLAKLIQKSVGFLNLQAYTVRTYKFCLFCARFLERFGIYYFSAAYYPFMYNSFSKDVAIN